MSERVWCIKCKKKQAITEPATFVMKNNREARSGKCAVCQTRLYRILGMKGRD